MSAPRRLLRLVAMAALAAMPAVAACRRAEEKPAPAAESNIRKDRYTVRGLVVTLPEEGNPSAEFQVRHEAIPHFVGQDGEMGMDTMTMPFPLAEGLSLAAIKVSDKIELTFEVDFDTAAKQLTGYRAVALSVLPADTALDFSPMKR